MICAVASPLHFAQRKRGYGCYPHLKFYVTWGMVLKGMLFAIIPGVNLVFSLICLYSHVEDVKVFKERKYEDS